MTLGKDFEAYAAERLAALGSIRIKRMFGGAGVYCDGLFFALLDDDELYLKVDDETRPLFENAGLKPFVFQPKEGPAVAMSYFRAPETALDDEDELRRWAGLALDAARRAAARKGGSSRAPRKKATGAAKARRK